MPNGTKLIAHAHFIAHARCLSVDSRVPVNKLAGGLYNVHTLSSKSNAFAAEFSIVLVQYGENRPTVSHSQH